jgi:hypothetical protein
VPEISVSIFLNIQSVQFGITIPQCRKNTGQLKNFSDLQPGVYFQCLFGMLVRIMFTKRVILLILGIAVAIAICLSTSLFGMKIAYFKAIGPSGSALKPYSDFIRVPDGDMDWKSVITEF